MHKIENSVSILISTYNGRNKLEPTLTYLSKLNTSKPKFVELVVVDNNSNDGTLDFTQKKWEELGAPYPLRLLSEKAQGKLNAQELGLSTIKSNFVLFCDDDNWLNPNYLTIGLDYFERFPKIGVIGGKGIPVPEIPLPDWFNEYSYSYACGPQAPKTGNVNPGRNVVYGAGMWMYKAPYDEAKEKGFKFLLKSREGKKLTTGGEDSELCWAIKLMGYEIWYVDELSFEHEIVRNRLSIDYREKLMNSIRIGNPYGRIYLRIWQNKIPSKIYFFWFKELMYSLMYILKLLFTISVKNKKIEYQRTLSNIVFYLKENFKYDRNARRILQIKNRIDN